MTLEPIHYFRFRNNVSVWAVSAACLILVSAGCKSGASFSKPSWWAFGGNTDPSQLASAPPYENEESSGGTGVSKPSAMASPYPTTTTPESYVMAGEAPRSSSSSPRSSSIAMAILSKPAVLIGLATATAGAYSIGTLEATKFFL